MSINRHNHFVPCSWAKSKLIKKKHAIRMHKPFVQSQIYYGLRPPDGDCFRNRAYSTSDAHDNSLPESMKLHVNVSANGDVDFGEVNLADMDPEIIKVGFPLIDTAAIESVDRRVMGLRML